MTRKTLSRGNQLTVSKLWDYFNYAAEIFGRMFDDVCGGKVLVQHLDIVSKNNPRNSGKIHCISFSANRLKFSSPWGSTREIVFFTNGVVGALAKAGQGENIPATTQMPVQTDQGFGPAVSPVDQHRQMVEDQQRHMLEEKVQELTMHLQHELGEKSQLVQAIDQAVTFLNQQRSMHSDE